ncbi:hypothetical protein J2Y64_000790 [Aeromonas salmonicida]|nr:hypothetical protein [Aeromonas salmonicida]
MYGPERVLPIFRTLFKYHFAVLQPIHILLNELDIGNKGPNLIKHDALCHQGAICI